MAQPGPQPLKNLSLSVMDLGLGDELTQQVQDEEDERKKKLASMTEVGGGMSPAVMSLFGPGAANNG